MEKSHKSCKKVMCLKSSIKEKYKIMNTLKFWKCWKFRHLIFYFSKLKESRTGISIGHASEAQWLKYKWIKIRYESQRSFQFLPIFRTFLFYIIIGNYIFTLYMVFFTVAGFSCRRSSTPSRFKIEPCWNSVQKGFIEFIKSLTKNI